MTARKLTEHAHMPEARLAQRLAAAADPDADGGEASSAGWLSRWGARAVGGSCAGRPSGWEDGGPKMGGADSQLTAPDAPPASAPPVAASTACGPGAGAGVPEGERREAARVAKPARRPRRAAGLPAAASDEGEAAEALAQLREYLVACGGAPGLTTGWKWVCEERKGGSSVGASDAYFFDAEGRRFRSKMQVARQFELVPLTAYEFKQQQPRQKKARRPG
eukprot:scaffold1236_cov116-Isochrysis_galbana.AAC.9